jgi:hypothetical protein
MTERLASHPKLLHALFVAAFVLTQAGTVVADNGCGKYCGP